jgi:hypothetical protein
MPSALRLLVSVALMTSIGMNVFAHPGFACSCQSLTPVELAQRAEVIFTGIARAYVREIPVERATVVEFDVVAVYRSEPTQRIQVEAVGGRGPSGGLGPGCEYGFQIGRLYTVFAIDPDKNGTMGTNGCLRNVEGPITAATYGLGPSRQPRRENEALALMIVGGFAVAILAILARLGTSAVVPAGGRMDVG